MSCTGSGVSGGSSTWTESAYLSTKDAVRLPSFLSFMHSPSHTSLYLRFL